MGMSIERGRLIIDGRASLLFSGEVHYWRLEPRYWRPVLERLRETGMNWVGTYVPWRKHDQGVHQYDFTGNTDPRLNLPAFLELCAEMELDVYFRPGPLIVSEMACGGYPDWLGHSGPGYMVWTATGEVPQGFPGEGNPGRCPSYLHPEYLTHCRRYLDAVNNVAAPFLHQNGGPIRLYQLDNEVSLICRDAMFQSDYNPAIIGPGGEYHQWLTAKYGRTENIPYADGAVLEDIQPPRNLADFGRVPVAWYFDWAEFKEWMLAEYIRRIKQMHLDAGVSDVVFCTNFNPHRPNAMPNNWDLERRACDAANPGLVGYDFYRGPFLSRSGYGSLARISRMNSSYFPLAWSAEFMCGTWKEDFSGSAYPFAEHHEFMADAALAHGLKGISWYMFHDRENWGGSPVSEQGHTRYAHAALREVMGFVRGAADFGALREPREVAVLTYRPYNRHCFIGDDAPARDSHVTVGEPRIDGIPAGRSSAEFEGLFPLLADAGFHPGAIDPDINPDDLAAYAAVFVPTQTFMDAKTQEMLLAYVRDGGTLFMGPAVPHKDLSLSPLPPLLASHVQSRYTGSWARGSTCRAVFDDDAETESLSLAFEGEMYAVNGRPRVQTTAGMPLITETVVGCGRILMTAGYLAQMDDPRQLADNAICLRRLLETCGIHPYATVTGDTVEVIRLEDDHQCFVYLLNHGHRAATVQVRFRDALQGTLHDLRGPKQIALRAGEPWSADVDAKRARLFRLDADAPTAGKDNQT